MPVLPAKEVASSSQYREPQLLAQPASGNLGSGLQIWQPQLLVQPASGNLSSGLEAALLYGISARPIVFASVPNQSERVPG